MASFKDALSGLKKGSGSFLGKLAFETFVEFYYDDIVKNFKSYLSNLQSFDIKEMVVTKTLPAMDPHLFTTLSGYDMVIDQIKPERFFKVFYDARPDLAEALAETGVAGIEYLMMLKAHIVALARGEDLSKALGKENVEKVEVPIEQVAQPQPEASKIYLSTCDSCGAEFPVTREMFDKITCCPFCGKSAKS